MTTIYFSLAQDIYATQFESAVIILDATKDQYVSLIDDAAQYFQNVLSMPFALQENGKYIPGIKEYDPDAIPLFNNWITEFTNQGFIIQTNSSTKKKVNPPAKIPGGLQQYQWDTKKDWKTVHKTSYFAIIKTLLTLIRVHRAIKKNGMHGLFTLIAKTKSIKKKIKPSRNNLESIIAAVDTATKVYPKKIRCCYYWRSRCIAW